MTDQQNDIKLEREFAQAYLPVREFTMVDWERCYSVWNSLNYVLNAGIPGALVECGVWKGGICMLMANTLKDRGVTDRDLYLYDTFAGMVEPTDHDVSFSGQVAQTKWQQSQHADHNTWCYAPIEQVRQNLASTGYDSARCRFVQGKTQDTLPATVPDQIALLRLDTDWYESTYHELTHLYPRLAPGGVIIFDDAYFWHGQRMAMERYFQEQGITLCLNRVGISSVAVKATPHGLSAAERQKPAA
ncbi:MAG: TylF/MycF/NovP-related O-methyltransferase [Planctomycetota bacterium]